MSVETASLTQLRANIYKLFDEIEKTKKPIYIKRKGRIYEIRILQQPNLPYNDSYDHLESNL